MKVPTIWGGLALLVLLLTMTGAVPASAHGFVPGEDIEFAQTIAGTELTVVVKSTVKVPTPLRVEIVAHHPVPDLTINLTVRSTTSGQTTRAAVRLVRGRAGSYPATLGVAETGPHELELRTPGEFSVLPFRVLIAASSPWEFLIHGGFYAAGILVVGGLLSGGLSRRSSAVAVGGGAVVGVVALTVALVSPDLPLPPPEGSAPAGTGGRPYALASLGTTPSRPRVTDGFALRLDLIDGSTGRPVDDLVTHHAALAHMLVTSEDGGSFQHVHPTRTGPGRLEVRLRTDRPGRYLVYAEIERADSGTQMVSGKFSVTTGTDDVTGTDDADGPGDAVEATGTDGPGDEAKAAGTDDPDNKVEATGTDDPDNPDDAPLAPAGLRMTPERPVAGRPTTIEFEAGAGLQPWLGMAGHLIVRDQSGGFLGHVHELGSMTGQVPADDTPVTYGPKLRFTFNFPRPGRYFAWMQFVRDFQIVTVPYVVTVTEEESTR